MFPDNDTHPPTPLDATSGELVEMAENGMEVAAESDEELQVNAGPLSITEKRRAQRQNFKTWALKQAEKFTTARINEDLQEKKDEELSIRDLMQRQERPNTMKNPRDYQLELFERAKQENTIAVLDTGSGKTLIAVLLLRHVIDEELERQAAGGPHRISFFLVSLPMACTSIILTARR